MRESGGYNGYTAGRIGFALMFSVLTSRPTFFFFNDLIFRRYPFPSFSMYQHLFFWEAASKRGR